MLLFAGAGVGYAAATATAATTASVADAVSVVVWARSLMLLITHYTVEHIVSFPENVAGHFV